MIRGVIYILSVVGLVVGASFHVPIYTSISMDIYYDSDVFNFSESDFARIDAADSLLTFNEFKSSIVMRPRIGIEYTPFISKKPLEIKFSVSPKYALSVPIKNTISYNASLRYKIKQYTYFKIWHSYIPKIYIRNFRDKDDLIHSGPFVSMNDECWFGRERIGISYTEKLMRRSLLTRSLTLSSMYFDEPFDEFNLRIVGVGLGIKYLEHKDHSLNLGAHISYADNYTRMTNRRSVSTYDRGYVEILFRYSFEQKQAFNNESLRLGVSGHIVSRKYISTFEEDPIHYNRYQTDNLLMAWCKLKIGKSVSIKPSISYRVKNISSPYTWVEKLKAFDKFNIGFKVSKAMVFDV